MAGIGGCIDGWLVVAWFKKLVWLEEEKRSTPSLLVQSGLLEELLGGELTDDATELEVDGPGGNNGVSGLFFFGGGSLGGSILRYFSFWIMRKKILFGIEWLILDYIRMFFSG